MSPLKDAWELLCDYVYLRRHGDTHNKQAWYWAMIWYRARRSRYPHK